VNPCLFFFIDTSSRLNGFFHSSLSKESQIRRCQGTSSTFWLTK